VPPPTAILESLTQIATVARPVAVLWHVALALALVALAIGWRPSKRVAALLLTTPLASVSVAFASELAQSVRGTPVRPRCLVGPKPAWTSRHGAHHVEGIQE